MVTLFYSYNNTIYQVNNQNLLNLSVSSQNLTDECTHKELQTIYLISMIIIILLYSAFKCT